jgi:hypothetical protein
MAIPATWRWRRKTSAGLDLTPSTHWPAPIIASETEHERGPILSEYRIDPKDREPSLVELETV